MFGHQEAIDAKSGYAYRTGDTAPAVITRTFGGNVVNLRVFCDGPDTLWVTSVQHDAQKQTARSWHGTTVTKVDCATV